jgi:CubicO group peptidase (beta-lactamase class C family)
MTKPIFALIVALLSIGQSSAIVAQSVPTARPEQVGMSSERLKRVGARMQEYIDKGLIAGAVTLIAREGKVVQLEAHGFRDREAGTPMATSDIFVMMSMTKPIASTALMMLYEEGKFLLTDPISNWLPEFAEMKVLNRADSTLAAARPITVRHVLTHTTGFTGGLTAPSLPRGTSPAAGESMLRARVRGIAKLPLAFQPGTRWQYGNSTDVVAALVEAISGQSMDDFLRERIFRPLGMNDTYYNVPREKWERRARVYAPNEDNGNRADPRPVTDPTPTTFFGGVYGLSSTAEDYFKFAQMVMNGGEYNGLRILSPKTVDLMITNHLADGLNVSLKGPGYGFGLGYSVLMDAGLAQESLTPGSYGWGGAYGTYYINDPTEELIGILMIQITSYGHLNIRSDLGTLAEQAIIEPKSSGAQKIRGYTDIN